MRMSKYELWFAFCVAKKWRRKAQFPQQSLNLGFSISPPCGGVFGAEYGNDFRHALSGWNGQKTPCTSQIGPLYRLNPLPAGPLWRYVPPWQQFVKKIFRQKIASKKGFLPYFPSQPTIYLKNNKLWWKNTNAQLVICPQRRERRFRQH